MTEEAEGAQGALAREGNDGGVKFVFSLRGAAEHSFETDIEDTDAQYSVTRALAGGGLVAQVNPRLGLTFDADAEFSWYDFSGEGMFAGMGGGDEDPVDDVIEITLRPGARYAINERWAVVGGAVVQFAGEYEADIGESLTYGGYLGSRFQWTKKFALTFGLGGKTRIEDNATVIPLLGVDWQINERFRLTTEGPGARLTASVNEDWSVFLAGGWRQRDYRLDEDDDSGELDEGVFRDERATIGVGVEWGPSKNVSIRLVGGAVVYNNLRLDDDEGVEVFEERGDATGFLSFMGSVRF